MNIELKCWSVEYKKSLIVLCNQVDRKYLSNRLPHPYTKECADWWLNMVCEQEGKSGIFRAIFVDGECVGNITIEQKEGIYCKDAEIGYLILSDYYSKGIISKACNEICELAFKMLDIVRITGVLYAPNIASRRVLEKNGFVFEGSRKHAVYKDGELYDECIYGKYG